MRKILLVIPYFGSWPVWFEAFLVSCAKNPSIHWLCPTDCEIPQEVPANITFLATSLIALNNNINTVVGVDVPLSPRKLCDLKPAYGHIFKKELIGYDFWGFCDMDIIWGDIRGFVTEELLDRYDIISSRKNAISGHFTIFRNLPQINLLYRDIPGYLEFLKEGWLRRLDEVLLTEYLKGQTAISVYWDRILCNQERGIDSHQEYYLNRWLWQEGKVINTKT